MVSVWLVVISKQTFSFLAIMCTDKSWTIRSGMCFKKVNRATFELFIHLAHGAKNTGNTLQRIHVASLPIH